MKKQSGFTLIELLLVLAIIGIISAIAIPALLGQREKAKAKATQSMVANVAGELARVNDDLRQKSSTPPSPTSVINAVLSLSNYKYPAAKNPYGGTAAPYINGSATGNGIVGLVGNASYVDPATNNKYPAVTISATYLNAGATSTIKKIVALD